MSEPPPAGPDEGGEEYGDMEPAGDRPAGGRDAVEALGGQDEGYLRLLIDVDHGSLRLLDAEVVDGPLVQTDLTGQMAYEALVGGRRVAADAFDDLSRQHGFAPPDDPGRGHSTGETARYQFVARVPLSEVTAAELSDVEITLMRPTRTTQLSEATPAHSTLSLGEAVVDAGEEAPEVIGRLHGIDLSGALSEPRAQAVRRRLR